MQLVYTASQQRRTVSLSVMTVWVEQISERETRSEGQQGQRVEAEEQCLRGRMYRMWNGVAAQMRRRAWKTLAMFDWRLMLGVD